MGFNSANYYLLSCKQCDRGAKKLCKRHVDMLNGKQIIPVTKPNHPWRNNDLFTGPKPVLPAYVQHQGKVK
jgi:hypothetical protein